MARLAKKTQTAFDELDWSYTAGEIKDRFVRAARGALGHLPGPCFDSIARVAVALAETDHNREIPTGYGAACVRHFTRRSEQLEPILKVTIERRYALIELTTLASIAGRWASLTRPRVTLASYRECVLEVTGLADATHPEREQWRAVFAFLLTSPCLTPAVLRNVAYALVWCGYFSPERSVVTDEALARQVFRAGREPFVRFRQEALRLASLLLELSSQQSPGGAA